MEQVDKKTSPLLTIEHLKKYYPIKGGIIPHSIGYVKAVDDISFTIYEGETFGLVGESGCGKSTIGRQIVGLEKPTEGIVTYEGQDLLGMISNDTGVSQLMSNDNKLSQLTGKKLKKVRTQLQMVFQDPYSSLNPRKHIYEILAQPMLYHKIATKETVQKELEHILDMVGLQKNVLGRYPHEFSGGQRQRIGIAKALSLNPRFLVCDEPVSALDVSIQAQILNLLKQLQKELHLTCLFIGHGLGAVHYVSDRIAVMYLGKIVEIADATELFSHPAHPYTKALCNAVPAPDPEKVNDELIQLQGEIGSSINPPLGCRFHPRCPYAVDICRESEPKLIAINQDSTHMVACSMVMQKERNLSL